MSRKPTCDCGVCEKCKKRIYMRGWYQAKTPEERRKWVERRDGDKVRAADRARYERDKSKRRAANDAYQRDHPERVARYKKEWAERNPEKRAAHIIVGNAVRSGGSLLASTSRRTGCGS